MERSLRFQAHFPIHFWGHCILTTTYLIKRLPSKPINNKSPFECVYGTPPPLDHLRIIGCKAFAHQHLPDKFEARAIPSVFIGYPPTQKGYILYNLETHKLFTSRHVTFHEDIFPFHTKPHTTSPQQTTSNHFNPPHFNSPTSTTQTTTPIVTPTT